MTLTPYQWSKQAARDPGKMDQELQKIQRTTDSIIADISGGGGPIHATRLTFTEDLYSVTTYATPVLASGTFEGYYNAQSGATIQGYGSVYDVSLKNRAGTVVLGVGPNTTTVTIPGNLAIAGTITFTNATDSTSPTTGAVVVTGGVGIGKALFVGTTVNAGTALTYTTTLTSATSAATPSAFVATKLALFANSTNGASLMGFGGTNDVVLLNQQGAVVLRIPANQTTVITASSISAGGSITAATAITSTLGNIKATNGAVIAAGANGQFAILRRDTDASAWALYSTSGSLQFFDNVAGVDKFTMATGGAVSFVSATALGFAVGPNGSSNPAWQIDTSVGSLAAGLKLTGAVAAGTVALAVISSGSNANLSIDAKNSGTITFGGTSTGAFTFTRSSTFTNGIANAGTIAAGTWNGTAILTTFGGTGLASYTAGDIVYWASGTTFTKLAIGTAGQFLRSTGTAPAWSTATFPSGATAGDLLYGSASNVWTALAIGSTSAILQVSGGFPAWTLTPSGLTSVSATTFAGALTGNASTATALQNARTIGGVSFDGTTNITVASATAGFAVTGALTVSGNVTTQAGFSSGGIDAFFTATGLTPSAHVWGGNFIAYGAGGAQQTMALRRINGTYAIPSAVLSGQTIGQIRFGGFVTSTVATLIDAGRISGIATENWTTTTTGMDITFATAATGTTLTAIVLTLGQDKSAAFTGVGSFAGLLTASASLAVTGGATVTTTLISTTAQATLSALSATQFSAYASTVSGATLQGYGTTYDVTLKNRAGNDVLGIGPNTLDATFAGKFVTTDATAHFGGGKLRVGNSATATIGVGVLADKFEVFDASGSSLGFVPIYATIT